MTSTKILSSTLSMIILSSVPAVAINNTAPLAAPCVVSTFSTDPHVSHLGAMTYSAIQYDTEVNEINGLMMKLFATLTNEPNEQFREIDKLIADNLIDLM